MVTTYVGTTGNDTFAGAPGANYAIYGMEGNDTLAGGDLSDTIDGGAGDDSIMGGAGDDSLAGGNAGKDTLVGGAGADTFFGAYGSGYFSGGDVISYASSSAGVTANLFFNDFTGGDAEGDSVIGFSWNLIGSSYSDVLGAGFSTGSVVDGGAGDDYIYMYRKTTAIGGDGFDTADFYFAFNLSFTPNLLIDIAAGTANPSDPSQDIYFFTFSGIENVFGGQGADTIIGTDQANTLNGGFGNDSLIGGGGADVLTDISIGSDTLSGGSGEDHLDGGAGADSLDGGAENDVLAGAYGNDTLVGGAGADTLNGGTDIDVASYAGSAAAVTVNLEKGGGIGGDAAGDVLIGIENLLGSAWHDWLKGDSGANLLDGSDGNDSLAGGSGADTLLGGSDNDRLDGGAGVDVLTGGGGGDVFAFAPARGDGFDAWTDTITDFVVGQDRIDLSAIDANALIGGDQAFKFKYGTGFEGKAGELYFHKSAGVLYGDTNGDRIADLAIVLVGVTGLSASDLIL